MLAFAAPAGAARRLVIAQVPPVARVEPILMEAQVIPPRPRLTLEMAVRGPAGFVARYRPMTLEDPGHGVFTATFTPDRSGTYEVRFAVPGAGEVASRRVVVHPGTVPASPWRILLPLALVGGYVLMWLRARRWGR